MQRFVGAYYGTVSVNEFCCGPPGPALHPGPLNLGQPVVNQRRWGATRPCKPSTRASLFSSPRPEFPSRATNPHKSMLTLHRRLSTPSQTDRGRTKAPKTGLSRCAWLSATSASHLDRTCSTNRVHPQSASRDSSLFLSIYVAVCIRVCGLAVLSLTGLGLDSTRWSIWHVMLTAQYLRCVVVTVTPSV